jgi:hypothetical protein
MSLGVWLAGTLLSDELVIELVKRLQRNGAEHTAQAIYRAAITGQSTAVLDSYDRRNVLAALDDRPANLEDLRGVLMREQARRQREGL